MSLGNKWREIQHLFEEQLAISSHDSPAVSSKFKMASNEKWEVVGKGGKKRAPSEGKKNKVKASDMPKADIVSE